MTSSSTATRTLADLTRLEMLDHLERELRRQREHGRGQNYLVAD